MIIPALDLMNGQIVRLHQGCYHKQLNYQGDPIHHLQNYYDQGANMVHLVDLNGAKNSMARQIHLLHKLIHINPEKKIQIGGGIRCTQDIENLLKTGATRIVFSSQAVNNPKITKKWFEYFGPESLVLALDIRISAQGKYQIAINGWQQETHVTLEEMIEQYCPIGLKHVLCTDISKDGTLNGSNIILYQTICKTWNNINFQSSGGIKDLTEIPKLQRAGVKSIIIGRAFLEKKFTVSEAISCWQNASSHV